MLRNNLRKRARISYYEPEERDLDEYIFCTDCGDYVVEYCAVHGPMLVIPDNKVSDDCTTSPVVPRAALTIPALFLHIAPSIIPGAGLGVFTRLALPADVRFGPYTGDIGKDIASPYCWQIHSGNRTQSHIIDAANPNRSNWMRYVNCSRHWNEQNLLAFQYRGQIYYRTLKIIPRNTELLVYYGTEYAKELGIDIRGYNDPNKYSDFITKTVAKDHTAVTCDNKDVEVSTNTSYERKPETQEEIIKIHFETDSVTFEEVNNNIQDFFKENFINYDFNKTTTDYRTSELDLTRGDYTIENVNIDSNFNENVNNDSNFNEIQCRNSETNFINTNGPDQHNNVIAFSTTDNITKINSNIKDIKYDSNTIYHKVADKRYIQCQMCNYHTYLEKSIKNHMKLHDPNRQFECNICHFKYLDRNGLRKHIGTVHFPKYQCIICNIKFSRAIYLEKHRVKVHTNSVGKNIHITDDNKNEVTNIDTSNQNSNDNFQNNIKDNSEMNKENMNIIDNDQNKTKNTQMNLSCTYLNINSNNEQNIDNIYNNRTEDDTNKIIDKTEPSQVITFSDQNYENLIKNYQEHLTTEDMYYVKCKFCGFKTLSSNTVKIKSHIQMHDEKRPFSCDLCHYRFSNRGNLTKHLTKVHAENKQTFVKPELNRDDIKTPVKCNICGHKPTSTQHFKRHMLLHDERRLFQCKFCYFRFSHQYDLTRHLTTVHKEKNATCSKPFNTDLLIDQRCMAKDISEFKLDGSAKNDITSVNKFIIKN